MDNRNKVDEMTIVELVYHGVQMYIERCGWNCYDETAVEEIADDIHRVYGVLIDYSVINDVINTKLSIKTTVEIVFGFEAGDL